MPKKVIAISGSPRKSKNTEMLLQEALRGAAEKGAETKLVRLYELKFHGCYSCFACKRLKSSAFGRCVHGDDLQAVLKEIMKKPTASSWALRSTGAIRLRICRPFRSACSSSIMIIRPMAGRCSIERFPRSPSTP